MSYLTTMKLGTREQEQKRLEVLMMNFRDLGAVESEPRWYLEKVIWNARNGEPFPTSKNRENPWQLYSSRLGCSEANAKLTTQAKRLFNSILLAQMVPLDDGVEEKPREQAHIPFHGRPDVRRPIKVSLDGGQTYVEAPEGVRVVLEEVEVRGEDDLGEFHLNLTREGVVTDVWVTRDESLDHNIGTESKTFPEIVAELVEKNG